MDKKKLEEIKQVINEYYHNGNVARKKSLAEQIYDKIISENEVVISKEEKQKLLKEMYEQGKFDAIADLEKDGKIVIGKEGYEKLLNQECLRGWIWKEGFNDGKKLYSEQLAQMRDTIKNLKKEVKEMEEQRDEQAYITEDLIQEKHRWTEQARKETAREILEYIEQNFSEEWSTVDCLYDVHEWISNTFDIDLGDEDED